LNMIVLGILYNQKLLKFINGEILGLRLLRYVYYAVRGLGSSGHSQKLILMRMPRLLQ